jgi:hypothetical protein
MSDNPLADRFPDLQPGKRPGNLGTVNGFGTRLVGQRDFDPETSTYVATHVFVALLIPIWAIAAYRVANAPGGGWYCLGRVPLSRFARAWNVFLVVAILGGIGGIWWNQHTKSPEYAAGQKLKRADEAAAAGKGGEAARLCREVMDSNTSRVEAARTKLGGFIENPPGAPAEAAAVYEVAVDLHRDNRCPVPDLFGKGKELAAKYAADDPAAALALLEVIAPFAPDTDAELTLRRDLLEKLFAKSPGDPEVASRLAAVYEQKGEVEKAEKVLVPLEARLGTLDGAAILGRIYAGRGKFDQAHALLAPYVAARLPEFREALQTVHSAETRIFESLKNGTAAGFDYEKLKRAPEAQRRELIEAYVTDQLKRDPALRTANRKLLANRGVGVAVLELGVVQLQRAQAVTDPAARKAELEAAEKTFLSIQEFAGQTAEYRLSLGQVYYWLGRPAEGKKLFDELLAGRGKTTDTVLQVAVRLREVGENGEARRLVEEVYNKEADADKRYRAAALRAVMFTDFDDKVLWLDRADPNDLEVRASLAEARGHKAERDGKDDEAANYFRQALATYAQMPESAPALNNCALAHFALFQVTLDSSEFTRGADKLDRAIALIPTNSIALLNGASTLTESAVRDTVGKDIDFRALKSGDAADALAYLYRTPAERAALMARLARHPGTVKARGYAEKLLLLAPKRDDSYQMMAALCEFTDDKDGLRAVAAKAAKANLDQTEDERKYMENFTGKSDDKKLEEARASVARTQSALAPARAVGGRTFALAVGRYVHARTSGWALGLPVDADELVKLADEVHTATPSAGTEAVLGAALKLRAHLALIGADAGYAATAKKTQRSFGVGLLYFALATDSPLRTRVAQNADVKRMAALLEEQFQRDPDRAGASEWVLLNAVGSAHAKPLGERASANERARAHRELERALSPYRAATALEEYWSLLLEGKSLDAKKVITDLAKKGVPVP